MKLKIILMSKLGRKKLDIEWDHSANLIHKFTVNRISSVLIKNRSLPFPGMEHMQGSTRKAHSE